MEVVETLQLGYKSETFFLLIKKYTLMSSSVPFLFCREYTEPLIQGRHFVFKGGGDIRAQIKKTFFLMVFNILGNAMSGLYCMRPE